MLPIPSEYQVSHEAVTNQAVAPPQEAMPPNQSHRRVGMRLQGFAPAVERVPVCSWLLTGKAEKTHAV